MHNPISTYRLQFHKEFNFEDFTEVISYLQELGVKTVYASPVFHSTKGSTHGYDGMNPHLINPEIGTEEQLRAISKELKEHKISWLQDIVPNHMAFHPENPWLVDVLEKGRQSVYASFFDIDWTNGTEPARIMLPFLGSNLEDVINNKELTLEYKDNHFVLSYFDSSYPLTPRSYQAILSSGPGNNQALDQLLAQMTAIHQVEEPDMYAERWHEFLLQLASLMKNEPVKTMVQAKLQAINADHDKITQLVNEQVYRLCYWQETDKKINFRRFFTVNGLICLNIQDDAVFTHFHSYIKELKDQGIFQGVRIDHIDGLHNPEKYLKDLRALMGDETYITVEKILEPGEELPDWPIQGNTGYDFLSDVNNLFTNSEYEKDFSKYYQKLTGDKTPVTEQILAKKAHILFEHMQGELDNLYRLFINLGLGDEAEYEAGEGENLKTAIAEFLIHCPVYRFYGNQLPLDRKEENEISEILKLVKKKKPELNNQVELLSKAILKKPKLGNREYNAVALRFYQRLMQFTGPLMAKGVEDTLMYTYNRFIAHNEVGDAPESFGISIDVFHEKMKARQTRWPLSANATSTHDTKRGEDVRARLNVLTDLPEEWIESVKLWQYLNAPLKQNQAPDLNDEYFIYQSLAGAYPMPGEEEDDFLERIQQYLEKALREGKQNSNWSKPDEAYETATKNFIAALLQKDKPFWRHFESFRNKILDYGIVNSLVQVLLKFTCPGVPDVYQGCELWDLSFVDPDNRRPVDYEKRRLWLEEISSVKDKKELYTELWQNRYNGKIKLWLTSVLLNERKLENDTFEKADYIPLKVKGKHKDKVMAFARRHKQTWYVVAVPLHLASMAKAEKTDLANLKWKNTRIILPAEAPVVWENVLLKTKGKNEGELLVKDLFETVPFSVLKLKQPINTRGGGILLHISSLPSSFGVGDMGPEAKNFADFLYRSKQKLWQILPLSPTEAGQGYSPYSAISSMAGNTLLISPELLVEEGLLNKNDLNDTLPSKSQADFKHAEKLKDKLFEKAFSTFLSGNFSRLQSGFDQFCAQEAYWLDSYALFIALKLHLGGKPWYQWPEAYKLRNKEALQTFTENEGKTMLKTKWLQFIFMKQWLELKAYANDRGIQLFGDLPFYVSYDSSDVWSHPEIFLLDNEGNQTGTAGVPPDYFNDNGQLWGMPVFRWDVLKQQNYEWWIRRISKNMELFDLLRLDHFRAFSSYWEVPANEETAKNGEWREGPGADFFRVLEAQLGNLPFIAEDLGDIDQPVYDLRDEFKLPGMKVLQFAFGDNLPDSIDIPHNYKQNFFVYTGTHDNNTTLGWFHQEADSAVKKRIRMYTGLKPKDKNIHKILARLAYSSVAKTAILPLQDVIGLDEGNRMNIPASTENNWTWRLLPDQVKKEHEKELRTLVQIYNRG
ncbi:malto-oligosyltrehalose synthase [Desertivirga xinjiangensis]|uniref:malto-oligosyltrehalose synthase n=1 Tax=Desertivirga xinjiangensis TaxID=539206 RepID=UPI00210D15C6|nr:malto-oligosyltrehalose synthase [Pedobacter xinjiangensis]